MVVWEILVPRRFNNGKPVRLKHHQAWDAKVRAIARGLTIMVPTVKGEWISLDGELFIDSTIPVRVSCERGHIEEIMDMTAAHYRQKAVMAYKLSDDVLIRHYEQEDT